MMQRPLLSALLFLILCGAAYGRFISDQPRLVSDGVPSFLRLAEEEEETCDQTYGFMPCTSTAMGNLFLILVYGYLMFTAATYLSAGSELLLEILGPGIVGGLFLPILGALPDAMLILVSGMSGSVETAQSQVSVGMGLLAGSTVMLLTVIWGSCILVGKCDLQDNLAKDNQDTRAFSLTGSGVSTDIWTTYAGIIMAISVIPFIIVQFPQMLHYDSGRNLAVLIGLIVSASLLIAYCLYQVFQPWVQKRRLDYIKHRHVMSGILKHLKKRALGKLSTVDGLPNEEVLSKLFKAIDENSDGYLSHTDLRALIIGIQFNEVSLDHSDAVEKVMREFDTSQDSRIDLQEFIVGVGKWLEEAKTGNESNRAADSMKYIDDFHTQTKRDHFLLGVQSEEGEEGVENSAWTTVKAVLLLLLGTAIAAAFADPLVDSVQNFSNATKIPTFFISFIALPLATNSSEAVSAIIFASRKKLRSASLTFSELYGAVTMNNVLCLSVFLGLVYARGLVWDFSSEVLVILMVCIVMGVFASVRTTFPVWTSLVAFLLYPFSLALVYVLDFVFGWS
ncbi:sodium/calcium exchanger NCL-like isoform X2 [Salvia splendens]|uniref:sodium/calcium exchanger NCL-like isoform X2 n=1 Tax=Salvia splendens TaxID=180675 RepID=UPI001C25B307|nr:sodium/calcium exchanger NCL-like isoform X2 [Salvia splendens]